MATEPRIARLDIPVLSTIHNRKCLPRLSWTLHYRDPQHDEIYYPSADARPHCAWLEQAAAIGDIKTLQEALSQWQEHGWASNTFREQRGNALYPAICNRQHETAEYQLQHGLCITSNAVTEAVHLQSIETLDLLLNDNWDVDMQLGLTIPSASAYVRQSGSYVSATKKGNSRAVEDANLTAWLLKHGASPNVKCALDLTPLSYAVQDAPFSTIRKLFDHGGDVGRGQILHYAVRRVLPGYLDVLAFVLNKDPPINHVMYQDDASSYHQQRILALGTPLHEAAELGRLDIVKILVSKGAQLLIRDPCGEVPSQRAERGRCMDVIEHLKPLTAVAVPPEEQFTGGKEATPWG